MDMFTLPQDITYDAASNGMSADLTELDPEESGFQSSFSRLGASEAVVYDSFAKVTDAKRFASAEIARASKERGGGLIKGLMDTAKEVPAVQSFEQYMASMGSVCVARRVVTV
jgi:exportin-2 (importin alpha re-exporter)